MIADCFARREARVTAAEMISGLLAEVDTRNCWTLAEALGHPGPHRLQHLLSRARFDHDRAREEFARLVVGELAGQEVVLVADETGDAKSSTDCVGAGRQYSGAIKGVGLCQVAVYLAAVTQTARVVIDRALYLPRDWAADEERREVAGVPEEIMFATKLRQTAVMVENALDLGVRARWFAGDEVYCGRELRRTLRELGLGYAVGVSHAYTVTDGAGRRWKARPGAVITADALHAQHAHAAYLRERGAHYLLTIKNNQPGQARQLHRLPWKEVPVIHRDDARGHGRHEQRLVQVATVDGLLFPHARQVLRIQRRHRLYGAKKWSSETVYAITALPAEQASVAEIAVWARGHWTVENTVHWVRDVVFGEDKSQVRTRNTPAALAAVHDLIRSALKLAGYINTAVGRRAHTERHRVLALYGIT
ncbi:ISAs1 family transposase [Streptomyces sp. NRRL S-813]|uniref:IS701 family transposase n=1 Tax=Streptomyces sp. NRRL S-813 TaxID=1463919 RepID=UPI001F368D5A|nr:ISAs1 family transposase [Streptomyces sp. NRRL S-813]